MRTQKANGWQYFSATLLIIAGVINIIQGLVALYQPIFYTTGSMDLLLWEYNAWSGLLGVLGVALIVAALTLLTRHVAARGVALLLAAINVIAQVGFVAAMPMWSLVTLALSVIAIYGLTAGWQSGMRERERPEEDAVYRSGYRAAHAAPRSSRSTETTGATRESQQTSEQGS